jgi:hypothetical protein
VRKEPKETIVLTADDVVAAPPALIRAGLETLPAAIAAAGAHTSERFIEFFTANIRNRNTRMAYALAVRQFFDWCEQRGLRLDAIKPTTVAAYIEQLGAGMAKPSVKQHLAAIRQLFDYLVTGGILPSNPAGAVRGPKYVVKRGKTPVLSADQARQVVATFFITHDRLQVGILIVRIIGHAGRIKRGAPDQTRNTAPALLVPALPFSTGYGGRREGAEVGLRCVRGRHFAFRTVTIRIGNCDWQTHGVENILKRA